jgi:hypothetical protein
MKKLFYLIPIVAAILTMAACKKDDDDDQHGLTANAGPDREAQTGETVQLDASASTDASGEGYETLWAFVSVPEGSSATISNPGSITASFTPDISGDYDVRLTISNSLGQSTDDVRITALAATTALSGSYNDDLHLVNIFEDANLADYVVSGNIEMFATMTIDPGVRIHVMNDRHIRIRTTGGIKAMGTADQPVIITGESEIPGFWKGILHESNNVENVFNHVQVSAAGSSAISSGRPKTAFHVENGRISIQHCSFTVNDGFGLSIQNDNSQVDMQENNFDSNSLGAMQIKAAHVGFIDDASDFNGFAIEVAGGMLPADSEHQWVKPMNGHYLVSNEIDSHGEVVINEGAEFRFESGIRFRVRNTGVIQAMGIPTDPIIFRGTVEQPGAWTGLFIESSSVENQLNHVHFSHAGHSDIASGYGKTALALASAARANLSGLMFSDIDGYGIYIRHDNSLISFDNLNFGSGLTEGAVFIRTAQMSSIDHASDFGNNYVVVDGGILNTGANQDWIKLQNGKYLFTSNADIYDRVSIEAGTVMEFTNDVLFRLRSGSVLIAQGMPAAKIVFTRQEGTGAHWKGIYYQSTSVESFMNYVEISYAGNSNAGSGLGKTNIGIDANARLTITNSEISNSLGWGIDVRNNGLLTESNNTFNGNALGDINYQ